MKKLLSLIALSCAMVLAVVAFAPRASAAMLTTDVLGLKSNQATTVQQARYRCWWRYGYRHCGYGHHRWWRHHHRYGYWGHRHWRNHYWRHRYWHNRYWRHHSAWRERYYGHRHYYYQSYYRPHYYRPYYRPYAYCIGLCWW
ncbi:MAG: hypothetical protein ACRD5Z_26340 [Bryobacteraceae bacterium]